MKGMIIGQYIRGDSIIHRLDPRTKLIGCFTIIVAMTLPNYPIPMLLLNVGFIVVFIYLSQVGVARVLRGLTSLWILFLFTFLCQTFLTRGGDPLLNWGGIVITWQGIHLGISTFLRLVIIFLGASLLTMTTSTLKLSAGIESLLSPLVHLRVPVHQFAMIINISLRFIPTIIEEAELIRRAQKSRGAQFDSGPLVMRLRTILAMLIPLLAASLQRAADLALAMESRCYTGNSPNNSRVGSLRFTWRDGVALGIFVLLWAQAFIILVVGC